MQRFFLLSILVVCFLPSCVEPLKVSLYNNSDETVYVEYVSEDDVQKHTLKQQRKTKLLYQFPAKLIVSSESCRQTYSFSQSGTGLYKYVKYPPSTGQYRAEAQIQKNLDLYVYPAGLERPVDIETLTVQGFRIPPDTRDCKH